MERYHIYKLGLAILFYAIYCGRQMVVNGLDVDDVISQTNAEHRERRDSKDSPVFYQGAEGTPGIDFPVFSYIPKTQFSCKEVETGYYADLETDCQVFHICNEGRKLSFLCPNGTVFEQAELTCEWWYKVNCSSAPLLYEESAEILQRESLRRKDSRRVPYQGTTKHNAFTFKQYPYDDHLPQVQKLRQNTHNSLANKLSRDSSIENESYHRRSFEGRGGRKLDSFSNHERGTNSVKSNPKKSTNRGAARRDDLFTSGSTLRPTVNRGSQQFSSSEETHRHSQQYSSSEETQVPQETASFFKNNYKNNIQQASKTTTNSYPNHRQTYSIIKDPRYYYTRPETKLPSKPFYGSSNKPDILSTVPLTTQIFNRVPSTTEFSLDTRNNVKSNSEATSQHNTTEHYNTNTQSDSTTRPDSEAQPLANTVQHPSGFTENLQLPAAGRLNSTHGTNLHANNFTTNTDSFSSLSLKNSATSTSAPDVTTTTTYLTTDGTSTIDPNFYTTSYETSTLSFTSIGTTINSAEGSAGVITTTRSFPTSSSFLESPQNVADSSYSQGAAGIPDNTNVFVSTTRNYNQPTATSFKLFTNFGNTITTSQPISTGTTNIAPATSVQPISEIKLVTASAGSTNKDRAFSSDDVVRFITGPPTIISFTTETPDSTTTTAPSTKSPNELNVSSFKIQVVDDNELVGKGFNTASQYVISDRAGNSATELKSNHRGLGTRNCTQTPVIVAPNLLQNDISNGISSRDYSVNSSSTGRTTINLSVNNDTYNVNKERQTTFKVPPREGKTYIIRIDHATSAQPKPTNLTRSSLASGFFITKAPAPIPTAPSPTKVEDRSSTLGGVLSIINRVQQPNLLLLAPWNTDKTDFTTQRAEKFDNNKGSTPGHGKSCSKCERRPYTVLGETSTEQLPTTFVRTNTASETTTEKLGTTFDYAPPQANSLTLVQEQPDTSLNAVNNYSPPGGNSQLFVSKSIFQPKPFSPLSTAVTETVTTPGSVDNNASTKTPTFPTYTISSASPFTKTPLTAGFEFSQTLEPTLPTPFTTESPLSYSTRITSENVNNMIDTLMSIANRQLGTSDVDKFASPRPGLIVPPSAGPQTLHTLAIYFANALDNMTASSAEESDLKTTTDFTEPSDNTIDDNSLIKTLLTQSTFAQYDNLFTDKGITSTETSETGGEFGNGSESGEDLIRQDTRHGLEPPPVRQLARIFTQALSAYLDDPEAFKRRLQDVRPTEPPLYNLGDDESGTEEDEILNYSDSDLKTDRPPRPTLPTGDFGAIPTWGYIFAFNNSRDVQNSLELRNSLSPEAESLQSADSQSLIAQFNNAIVSEKETIVNITNTTQGGLEGEAKNKKIPENHWTKSPDITKLLQTTFAISPLSVNEKLETPQANALVSDYFDAGTPKSAEDFEDNIETTTYPPTTVSEIRYDIRALPKLELNSTQVHGILIDFMNSTQSEGSAKLIRILHKLNITQEEFLVKMKEIEENPLTRRLILLLISECNNDYQDLASRSVTVQDILDLAQSRGSEAITEAVKVKSLNLDIATERYNGVREKDQNSFKELVDPSLGDVDEDTRALQLLNSLYVIASKFGK